MDDPLKIQYGGNKQFLNSTCLFLDCVHYLSKIKDNSLEEIICPWDEIIADINIKQEKFDEYYDETNFGDPGDPVDPGDPGDLGEPMNFEPHIKIEEDEFGQKEIKKKKPKLSGYTPLTGSTNINGSF